MTLSRSVLGCPARVVTVLGMHRSGTSCLTGSLQASGLTLGKVFAPAAHNKKGNQENPDIVAMHDVMLASNNANWDAPIARCEWTDGNKNTATRIVNEYAELSLWGFKDPRTLMTIDGWLELIPHLERVGIFRHPLSVAQSLAARNKFPTEKSLKIWFRYNSLLLREYKRQPFPIISFDAKKEDFLRNVRRLVDNLHLDFSDKHSDFFAEDLRAHNEKSVAKLPIKVMDLYSQLKKIAW